MLLAYLSLLFYLFTAAVYKYVVERHVDESSLHTHLSIGRKDKIWVLYFCNSLQHRKYVLKLKISFFIT